VAVHVILYLDGEEKAKAEKQNKPNGSFVEFKDGFTVIFQWMNLMIKVQKLIDHSVNIYNNIHNITATLSAL
jgi:hypothetical protein